MITDDGSDLIRQYIQSAKNHYARESIMKKKATAYLDKISKAEELGCIIPSVEFRHRMARSICGLWVGEK